MFESLTGQKREGGIVQPAVSFAVHASLIAFAVGAGTPTSGRVMETEPPSEVIYIPATHGTRPKVETEPGAPMTPPICQCEAPIPGPIVLDDFEGGLPRIPGPPSPSFPGVPGRSILDSTLSGVSGVFTEGDLTDSPVLEHFRQPVYPPALKAAGKEGQVQVAYVVDSDGRVEPGSIIIVSTDHPLMSESVRVSLRAAQFRSGKVRGMAVRTLVRQTIRFSLMSL